MQETGEGPAEIVKKKHVLRRRRNPFLTSDNGRYAHEVIVDDSGQVVSGEAIRLQQNGLIDLIRIEAYPAANHVRKGKLLASRYTHADDRRFSTGQPAGYLLLAKSDRKSTRLNSSHLGISY